MRIAKIIGLRNDVKITVSRRSSGCKLTTPTLAAVYQNLGNRRAKFPYTTE